jgi:hypothetical protein
VQVQEELATRVLVHTRLYIGMLLDIKTLTGLTTMHTLWWTITLIASPNLRLFRHFKITKTQMLAIK